MSRNNPLISIVVPTYNRGDLIKQTLTSLLSQSYTSFEIIVVDDGSTDNTEEQVAQISDARLTYYKKENAERAAARNYGARLAKGAYVNFFDSDDFALTNHLQEAVNLLYTKEDPQWFHLGYAWAEPDKSIFKKINNFRGETLNDLLATGNVLSCNGVFIRKDIILKYPFNEDRALSASEDYELWCRLAARFPLHYSNIITSLIIDHDLRSVRTMNGDKLIERINLLLSYLRQDEVVLQKFGVRFKQVEADSMSYIALHLADQTRYKWTSAKYLVGSVYKFPFIFFNKRTLATLKNIFIKW